MEPPVIKPRRFTRYFTFVKVNPKMSDYDTLDALAGKLGAFVGYKTMKSGSREYLAGFVVLCHQRGFVDNIYPYFPNFLVKPMDANMDWSAVERTYDRVFGIHPFSEVKRNLFP